MTRMRLKYLADVSAGQSPSSEDVGPLGDGLPFLQGNAEFGPVFPVPRYECASPSKVAAQGDVLVSVRAPVGAVNIASSTTGIGRGLCAVRPRLGSSKFYFWWLQSKVQELGSIATGSTFAAVSGDDLRNLEVDITDPGQQQAIADYLDRETAEIDAFIADQERLIELLNERRSAALLHLTVGRTDTVFTAPLGRLLLKLQRPVREESEVVTAFRDGTVAGRWNRREDGFTFSVLEQGYQGVEAGDLVFHGLDGFAGAVGISSDSGKCSPVYHVCETAQAADTQYMALLLRALGVSGFLEAYAWSVRQRSVDYRNWATFSKLPVAVPSRAAQEAAVAQYYEISRGIEFAVSQARSAVMLSKERRSALISSAVSGRIDVRGQAGEQA